MDTSPSEETPSGCPLDETTDELHTGETDDAKEEKQNGLSAQTEEPGGSEAVKMEEADGEPGAVKSAAAEEEAIAQPVTAMVTAGDDEPELTHELEKQVELKSEAEPNAVNCSVAAAENTVKEIKEQREETQLPVVDCEQSTATCEYTTAEEKITSAGGDLNDKRRASVEISSSDGEPLSRMDSEDSISSTLMDMESTVSSGRSTPAMMTDHGSGSTLSSAKSVAYACRWDLCLQSFNSSPDLAEHIRGVHVDGQKGGVFVCLWKGCKVYNTPSTSPSWLQRHMLTHSGDRPFKCVVGGCNASFASQGGLARHVPSHFSQQSSKLKEDSPAKAALRRKKLKNKRRRSLPRPHDFFDAQTMDAIRHRAICLNLATHIEGAGNGHSLVFHSAVLARRKEGSGKVKVLLHWTPEDILPDVWVSEAERSQLKTKVVHLSQLPQDTATLLDPNIYRALPQKRLRMSI